MKIDINNSVFNITPLEDRKVYFPDVIHDYLDQYINYVLQIGVADRDILAVRQYSQNISICLQEYYCGQHSSARCFFDKAIKSIHLEHAYTTLQESTFYRARRSNAGKRLTADELFHIPFEKRYLVTTQRYSYPGLPCLYLGSSPEVCCEELRDWSDDLNVAQLEWMGMDELNMLDLTFFERYDFKALAQDEASRFVRLWPLIACCSFAYLDTDDIMFHPDYVLPQLLLEHVIDKNADIDLDESVGKRIAGIKYHSVRKPIIGRNAEQNSVCYHNYVFPALSGQRVGHCATLRRMFKVIRVSMLNELQLTEQR